MTIKQLASHIISVANQNQLPITNLQLQKIMFFIFGILVKEKGPEHHLVTSTHSESFRRWSYGPVIESIYFDYNHFGGQPIKDTEAHANENYSEYDERIVNLLKKNPYKLVEVTHRLPSWANYKEKIINREFVPPYELEDFSREFGRSE